MEQMKTEDARWQNWSGSLRFAPGERVRPESEEEVVALVRQARREKRSVRVVGAGHSSSPLVETGDYLLSLDRFSGVEQPDGERNRATVLGGTVIRDAGRDFWRYGMAMHNTGDVDVQTLAGAIGTGTHGTGNSLRNLADMLVGVRMVTGTGDILEANRDEDPELFRALRVSLGTCGIFLSMRVQLEPAFELHRREWCVPVETCLDRLEELRDNNRTFDFYWYPRSQMAKVRVMNKADEPMPELPGGTLEREKRGPAHIILPRSRTLRFDEMEYAVPAEKGPDCFREVAEQVRKRYRKKVGWRVLYRTIKEDDAWLSEMSGRQSVTISLHQNAGLPYREYFRGIEPIFRKYGGRPHWGKKHSLEADELAELYPGWDRFQKIRRRLDPDGVFLTPYLQKLLVGNSE